MGYYSDIAAIIPKRLFDKYIKMGEIEQFNEYKQESERGKIT
jgi:hypothetical protein